MPRVVLAAVTKVFERPGAKPVRAVSGVSFTAEERQCLAILGPSGSGKTTLLRLIAGLESPSAGQIFFGDENVTARSSRERNVAVVFQTPALYPHLSVFENLGFGLRVRGCPRAEVASRVGAVAETLGLIDCLAVRPAELSGGQRQRVAIGRALVRRPGLLLLDEPLANVDPVLCAQLRTDLSGLRHSLGTTLIYVTHDQLEAMMIADQVLVLREGQVQQIAKPADLYHRPATRFVAGFVGSPPMNFFMGEIIQSDGVFFFKARGTAGSIADAGQGVDLLKTKAPPWFMVKLGVIFTKILTPYVGRSIVLGLRPEQIKCVSRFGRADNDPVLTARVVSIQNLGCDVFLTNESAGHSFLVRVGEAAAIEPGQECSFVLNLEKGCFFDPVSGKAINASCAS